MKLKINESTTSLWKNIYIINKLQITVKVSKLKINQTVHDSKYQFVHFKHKGKYKVHCTLSSLDINTQFYIQLQ